MTKPTIKVTPVGRVVRAKFWRAYEQHLDFCTAYGLTMGWR